MEDELARIRAALMQRHNDVLRNAFEQLDAVGDLLQAYSRYMSRSGRAVLGSEYQQRQPQQEYFDPDAWPTRRN